MRLPWKVGDSEKVTARNESEAEERFIRSMNRGLGYLTRRVHFRSARPRVKGQPWRLTLTPDEIAPLICEGHTAFYLSATAEFIFERDQRPGHEGGTKARVTKYIYVLQADQDPASELVSWHWHPDDAPERPDPHVHVRSDHEDLPGLRDMHLPSGRVLFEDVLLYAIKDLGVGCQEGTEANLREMIERTRRYNTW